MLSLFTGFNNFSIITISDLFYFKILVLINKFLVGYLNLLIFDVLELKRTCIDLVRMIGRPLLLWWDYNVICFQLALVASVFCFLFGLVLIFIDWFANRYKIRPVYDPDEDLEVPASEKGIGLAGVDWIAPGVLKPLPKPTDGQIRINFYLCFFLVVFFMSFCDQVSYVGMSLIKLDTSVIPSYSFWVDCFFDIFLYFIVSIHLFIFFIIWIPYARWPWWAFYPLYEIYKRQPRRFWRIMKYNNHMRKKRFIWFFNKILIYVFIFFYLYFGSRFFFFVVQFFCFEIYDYSKWSIILNLCFMFFLFFHMFFNLYKLEKKIGLMKSRRKYFEVNKHLKKRFNSFVYSCFCLFLFFVFYFFLWQYVFFFTKFILIPGLKVCGYIL